MPFSKIPPKVVLIEPNLHDKEVFESLLAGDGYIVEAVTAVSEIQTPRENVDLVISEIDLRDGDSFDLCYKFQKSKRLRDVPFLFLSEQQDAHTIEDAYGAGASAFCGKPISSHAFISQVRSLIKMRGVYKENQAQKSKVREAALASMKEAERLRAMVNFLHHAFECHSYADLVRTVFDFCRAHKYEISIIIYHDGKPFYYADDGQSRPLEEKIMKTQWEGIYVEKALETRIIAHKGRVIASFDHCCVLVRRTGEETAEELLDFFGFLMNSLERLVVGIAKNSKDPLAPAQLAKSPSTDDDSDDFDEDDDVILF